MKPRPAHADEVAAVRNIAASITQELQDHPDASSDTALEALLSTPIPDNPLVEGVGTTALWCGSESGPEAVDWLYCPDSRTVTAVIPTQ